MTPPALSPIFDKLEGALEEVLDGALSPQAATAAASLGRALATILQVGELEQRISALELKEGQK